MQFSGPFLAYLQKKLTKQLLANVSPPDTLAGCVIASHSRENPAYFYHWFRDAALAVQSALHSPTLSASAQRHLILDWFSFEAECARSIDKNRELRRAGEPKVHVDAKPFTEPWGRPQNDSSALRLFVGLEALELLHRQGFRQQAARQFELLLVRDLHYTAEHIGKACFDVWEEVHGMHFATLATQCAALSAALLSRWLSAELRDTCSAALQRGEAQIADYLEKTDYVPYIVSTLHPNNYGPLERGWCDSSVLLAVCKCRRSMLLQPRVVRTVLHLANQFAALYPLNRGHRLPLLGRYAEDHYYGGNPWPICTCFAIEWCYSAAAHLLAHPDLDKETQIALQELLSRFGLVTIDGSSLNHRKLGNHLTQLGDQWFERLLSEMTQASNKHSIFKSNFHYSEQLDRTSGRWCSAERLTWNYAALLDIVNARIALEKCTDDK